MTIGRPTQLLINGEWVNSVSGKTFVPINPANETVCDLCAVLRFREMFK